MRKGNEGMQEVMTEQARENRIAEAVAAAQADPERRRTEQLRWKDGDTLLLTIVRVPLDATVLNPGSHRIKAHIEAMGDHAAPVKSDPYGPTAQGLIAKILRSTPGYGQIRGALERDGQLNAGVLTHKGVLVNANTRRCAFEDLGIGYIDVVVLPQDASEKEITDLELELQMERDVKQEYTFTARLLFIKDLVVGRGMSAEEVGLKLERALADTPSGRKKAREIIEQEMRLLRLIREVVSASDGAIKITKFDDDRQELIEIDQDYERERQRNPERAIRVRDAQLTGLIADLGYKKMREVDEQLIDDYLEDALREQAALGPYVADLMSSEPPPRTGEGEEPGGLDLLEGLDGTATTDGPNTTRLFTTLASVPEEGELALRDVDGDETAVPRSTVVAGLFAAFSTAIDARKRDSRSVDKLRAPMTHLSEAARSIDRARTALNEVAQHDNFDRGDLDAAVGRVRRAFDEFRLERDGQ